MTGELQCAGCGAIPAERVVIRRHVGMVVAQKFYKVDHPLCRKCGLSLIRGWTGRTLIQGWWGYISFFVNWFVLFANGAAALKLSRLKEPSRYHLIAGKDPAGISS